MRLSSATNPKHYCPTNSIPSSSGTTGIVPKRPNGRVPPPSPLQLSSTAEKTNFNDGRNPPSIIGNDFAQIVDSSSLLASPPPPPPPIIQITTAPSADEGKIKGGKGRKKGHGRSKSAHAQTWATADPAWRQQFNMDILRLQMNDGMLMGHPMGTNGMMKTPQQSPSVRTNIRIPKRRYSVWRKDSLIDIETLEFTEMERRLHKSVPSSPQTVLALSGLFVCGLMLLLSGTIVLLTQKILLIRLAGLSLLLFGLFSLSVCALLQRKNIGKWLTDMTRDLFALREADAVAPTENGQKSALGQVPGSFIRQ